MPIMQPTELRKVRHHNRAALKKFPKVNSGIVKMLRRPRQHALPCDCVAGNLVRDLIKVKPDVRAAAGQDHMSLRNTQSLQLSNQIRLGVSPSTFQVTIVSVTVTGQHLR